MKTYLRNPIQFEHSFHKDTYASRYFTQTQFKGIMEDDNIYAIDQHSFEDVQNVYVNEKERLVSRPTLQVDTNVPVTPTGCVLVDLKEVGIGRIYIYKTTLGKYYVLAVPNETVTLDLGASFVIDNSMTKYHISIIEHYIICFNDIKAMILDADELNKGWQNFTDFAEVPVIKIVVGDTVSKFELNNFIPNKYKEEYVWNNSSYPQLPNGTGDVEVVTSLGKFTENIPNTNIIPELRITRPVNYLQSSASQIGLISAVNDIITIAYSKYFDISYNKGATFTRVYYPAYDGDFMNLGEVSKDGNFFFFLARDGLYRCNLGDLTWSKVFRGDDGSGNADNIKGYRSRNLDHLYCYFLSEDIFAFITIDSVNQNTYLYFKGPGLYSGTDYTADRMNPKNANYYILSYVVNVNNDTVALYDLLKEMNNTSNYRDKQMNIKLYNGNAMITITTINSEIVVTPTRTSKLIMIIGGQNSFYNTNKMLGFTYDLGVYLDIVGCEILDVSVNFTNLLTLNFHIRALVAKVDGQDYSIYNSKIVLGNLNGIVVQESSGSGQSIHYYAEVNTSSFGSIKNFDFTSSIYQLPLVINETYIMTNRSNGLLFVVGNNEYTNDRPVRNGELFVYTEDTYYLVTTDAVITDTGYAIWTNALQDEDSATITYTIGSAGNFTKVPTVSYSDTELYLGFDNLLQITKNSKDPNIPTKILFNLPDINNQSFINDITSMINISTTEIALFFKDTIRICSKQQDELLGYRYDYYNTKISAGVRLGDSTINTLEGSYTIFPTRRGLAALNYQAFMATTDQTITYLTDRIRDIWTEFYLNSDGENKSNQIRIIQYRNKLVITNYTDTILIFDLDGNTWWKWKLPKAVLIAISNQLELRVIHNELLVFEEAEYYYDFSKKGRQYELPIDWYIISQPLHMSAPNYYKNLKQLIFLLHEEDRDNIVQKTMNAQIKLYRKHVTIREPETVQFKIETLRTFVKRFNYWKINEVQWALSNDDETDTPKRFELDGITVKYELGEEVR